MKFLRRHWLAWDEEEEGTVLYVQQALAVDGSDDDRLLRDDVVNDIRWVFIENRVLRVVKEDRQPDEYRIAH